MSAPDVSIVIRTLNEERYLPELLKGIASQETCFSYEILLIDSGSTDQTIDIARRHGCRLLHIRRAEFSFGRSLNRACEAAAGKYLAMISGHCIPCNSFWLQHLITPLAEGFVHYAYGRQLGGPQTHWSEHQIFGKYFPAQSRVPQHGFYCNNANSAVLASTWAEYRFDEHITGLEDMHLAKRLTESGGRVGYIAEASVFHLHHESWSQVQKRFEREALALRQICPELLLRRRDLIRYFSRGVLRDIITSAPRSLSTHQIGQIISYRYHQYIGSYKGNRIHRLISSALLDSYFYPTIEKGLP